MFHPQVDPRFEGDARVRYVYMSYCNDDGVSGSPPIGWMRWDRTTGEERKWVAPPSLTDICLCTLMTADRVPSLHRLSRSWGHLLSIAYLADDFEADAARGFELLSLPGSAAAAQQGIRRWLSLAPASDVVAVDKLYRAVRAADSDPPDGKLSDKELMTLTEADAATWRKRVALVGN